MINNYLQFISNNVKGLQSLEKRVKVFEYLKNCISNNGFMFLQEMHSTIFHKKRWQDEHKGKLFFSHRHSNSCRVAISFLGNINFVLDKIQDNDEQILILDVKVVDNTTFLLIIYITLIQSVSNLMF